MANPTPLAHLHLQPRAWLTRDYWRLDNLKTTPTSHGGWSNDDVDVVEKEKRTWRELDYLWLWLADGANVGTMFVSTFLFYVFSARPGFSVQFRDNIHLQYL